MVFSFWNVITLIIVLVVLAIYRQLDVRNRSLEKVKKYSDKVLKSMNGLVDERARQMKDMAIERSSSNPTASMRLPMGTM